MHRVRMVIAATFALGGLVVLFAASACGEQDDIDLDEVFDELLGGETTAFSKGRNAFELSARNLHLVRRDHAADSGRGHCAADGGGQLRRGLDAPPLLRTEGVKP